MTQRSWQELEVGSDKDVIIVPKSYYRRVETSSGAGNKQNTQVTPLPGRVSRWHYAHETWIYFFIRIMKSKQTSCK